MDPSIEQNALALLGVRRKSSTHHELPDLLRERVTYRRLETFRIKLAMSRQAFGAMVDMSPRTLSRYAGETRVVGAGVAERAYRVARIRALADYVLEDSNAASDWLKTPQAGLGGRIPNDLLASEIASRDVETLLQRIEHGVYA